MEAECTWTLDALMILQWISGVSQPNHVLARPESRKSVLHLRGWGDNYSII
jgi:hypothetical protein